MIETEGEKAQEEAQVPTQETAKVENPKGDFCRTAPSLEQGRADWPRVKEGEEGELTLVPPACIGAGSGNAEAMVASFQGGGVLREMTTAELSLGWCHQLQMMARQMRDKGFLSASDALEVCIDTVKQHTS